ncbi:hypothetical protein [Methanoregula sp.]|uniref:hypothetical protein n=1 Tax=Methanoregula sp. TaxID=2052170 RepID=UPI002C35C8EF|nr:hypothetical protein [Methanoregula sp.]HVP96088.1 hypothetical protein [Methanoregula sp.]
MEAFQGSAARQDLAITSAGYMAAFRKDGITTTGPGVIRMTVSPGWVDRYGGNPTVRIVHMGDDNVAEILGTTYSGTDSSGNRVFEADSPYGLSVFALITVKSEALPPGTANPQNKGQSWNILGVQVPVLPGITPGNFLILAACLIFFSVTIMVMWKRRKKYDWLFMK